MRTRLTVFILFCALIPAAPAAKLTEGFVVTEGGAWIHYVEGGPAQPSGPTLLFVPGWTMPGWIWEGQLEHFGRTHRVVAMDPRSQGQSSQETEGLYPAGRAADIRAVVADLKLAPVVLVGWSMAVTELLSYVRDYGTEGIAGLVLVDGSGGIDMDTAGAGFLAWLADFQADRIESTRRFVRSMYATPREEAYLERVTEAALKTPTNTAVALSVGSMGTDNRDILSQVDRPTLFVAARGPYTAIMKEQADQIPGVRWALIENAGHALFVDQAEAFNELVAEFVGRLN